LPGRAACSFEPERGDVAKLPDIPGDTPLRPIKTAAIIGAGTMGGGIAMSFAEFGFPVKLLEASQEALDRGIARIHSNYCPGGQTGTSHARRSVAREGTARRAWGPPVRYRGFRS
jgi:NADPH-dependent 2,4-dienoyl-CoA reductase/sulfur reductase-like enzyme